MPRAFNVDAPRTAFELPLLTRQQIQALTLDLDLSAREVVIRSVSDLWQREMGEPERDVFAEIDEIKAHIQALNVATNVAKSTGSASGSGKQP